MMEQRVLKKHPLIMPWKELAIFACGVVLGLLVG